MPKLTFSIALCTYQGARYIQEQLDSIATQTRPPDEIVLCDDGSTDNTLDIVNEFADSAPFSVRIHRNDVTLGVAKNFERAIRRCEGNVIVLCDQDDVWLPHKLSVLEAAFENSPKVNLFFSNASLVDDRLIPLGNTLWNGIRFSHREQHMIRSGDAFRVLLRHNVVTGATTAFRSKSRDVVLPIPHWDIHDSWIALLIAATGEVGIIDDCLIQYRQHSENQIGAKKRGLLNRWQRPRASVLKNMRRVLKETETAAIRLQECGEAANRPDNLAELVAKKNHLEARIHFVNHDQGWFRALLGELFERRYHRYSEGWSSVMHDVLNWFPRLTVAKLR